MMKKVLFTVIIAATISFNLSAQDAPKTGTPATPASPVTPATKKNPFSTWSVSANFGSMLFYGDIREYDFYPLGSKAKNAVSERKSGFGFSINKTLSPTFSLQGQLLKGNLSGAKRSINKYFEASTFEYSVNTIININKLLFKNAKPTKMNFYGTVGVGYLEFRSVLRTITANSPNESDPFIHSNGYTNDGKDKKATTTEVLIPIGLGVKYQIKPKISIYAEATLRNVNTDKLDARSIINTARDKYGYTCIGITYHLGKNGPDEKPLEYQNDVAQQTVAQTTQNSADLSKKLDSLANKLKALDSLVNNLNKVKEFKDDDADGVANENDLELDTKPGALVNFQGKTIPTVSEPTSTVTSQPVQTNTQPTQTIVNNITNLSGVNGTQPLISVFFELGSASLDMASEERIAVAAKMMKVDPSMKIILEGHADRVGNKSINDKLSEARAKAVKNVLIRRFGIEESRIQITFKGNTDPLSNNLNRINRRVDFILAK